MTPQDTQAYRFGLPLLIVMSLLTPLTGTIRAAQKQAVDMGSASMTAVTHVATTAVPVVVQLTMTAQPGVVQPAPADPTPSARHALRSPALPGQFKRPMMGLGSGILMDAQGYILTNHHVIQGATMITAILADKRAYPARVIGVDVKTDLAVLKIDAPEPLPYAIFGDSDKVEVGTWVVAIGHPQGLAETVTHGIISGKHRHGLSEANGYEDFLQTDAAMNPGNSGGPLLNLRAEVIGINTTIVSQTGGFEGMGFAIPSNMALAVARALIASGKVEHAWFGVEVHDVTHAEAQGLGLPAIHGVVVDAVVPGGPAAQSGLLPGDVVLAYQAQPIVDINAFRNAVLATAVGQPVQVTLVRRGQPQQVTMTPEDGERVTQQALVDFSAHFGVAVRAISLEETSAYELAPHLGVTITQVQPTSVLGRLGFEVHDILLAINNHPLTGVESLAELTSALQPPQRLVILGLDHRSGETGVVQVELQE
jgi:serine protease Do